jgi:hypothetical protein
VAAVYHAHVVELGYSYAPDQPPVVTLECAPDFSLVEIVRAPHLRRRVSRLEAVKGVSLAMEDGRMLRFALVPLPGNDGVEVEIDGVRLVPVDTLETSPRARVGYAGITLGIVGLIDLLLASPSAA